MPREPRPEVKKIEREISELEHRAAFVAAAALRVKNQHERRIWKIHAQNLRREAESMKAGLSRLLDLKDLRKSA